MKTEIIVKAALGFWRKHRTISIVVCLLALALVATLGQCGCGAVGIANPEVRAEATVAADLFRAAYDLADDDVECVNYLGRASNHLLGLMQDHTDILSEEDMSKIIRLMEGAIDVMESIGMKAYVRQRCLSLAAMADSIGRYDDQALADEVEEARENYGVVEENTPAE